MTKAQIAILETLLGHRNGPIYTRARPYTDVTDSNGERAAHQLEAMGLCVVMQGPRQGMFTAYTHEQAEALRNA